MIENKKCDLSNFIVSLDDLLLNLDISYDNELKISQGHIYQLRESKIFDLLKTNSTFLNRYNGKKEDQESEEYELFDYNINDNKNTTCEFNNLNFAKLTENKLYLLNYKLSHKSIENIFDDFLSITEKSSYVIYMPCLSDPLIYDIIFILKVIFPIVILVKDNDWLKDTFKIYCENATKVKDKLHQFKSLNKTIKQQDPELLPYKIYHEIPQQLKNEILFFTIDCYNEIVYNASLMYASYTMKTYINKYEKILMNRGITINK